FPMDLYSDELDMSQWPRDKKIAEISGITRPDSAFKIEGPRPPAGWYLVEVQAKDKYGETVKDIRYIRLDDNRVVSPQAEAYIRGNLQTAKPGDSFRYRLISNIE